VAGRPEVRSFSEAFFDADILFFGGTALVPPIHDSLTDLVRRGRESGALIVVTTVYDFRNEKRSPSEPWPLVDDYSAVDLVCTDHVEALRISGASDDDAALDWFIDRGVGAAIITRGPEPVLFRASRGRFRPTDRGALPVCAAVGREIERSERAHDTTGCGDNFVGGVLTSIMEQLSAGAASISLEDAVVEGNVAGGFAATYLGGLYTEARAGDKRGELERLRSAYLEQRA
jgi:sugar/nucleoside kinase (ribokinase family)